jgi:hypothetical protein
MSNGSTNTLRLVVGWLIVTAWFTSLVLDAVMRNYDVPPTVHGLMLLVAGALFGPTIAGRRRNGNGE